MTCTELIDRILDYLDRELADDQRSLFELHLAACPNCVFYLESYNHTVRLTRQLPRCGHLPAGVEGRLRAGLARRMGGG